MTPTIASVTLEIGERARSSPRSCDSPSGIASRVT